MPLLAKDERGPFEKPEPGMHAAICVFVEDIGTHQIDYQGQRKLVHQVVVCWEIDQLMQTGDYAGKPFMVSKKYNFTLNEKGNLSADLESWFSKKIPDETRKSGFDLETLVGRRATVNLVEGNKGYINVGGILPAMPNNTLSQVCTAAPKWIQKLRDTSIEAQKSAGNFDDGAPAPTDSDVLPNGEDLPF